MSEIRSDSFTHVLVNDVIDAEKRVQQDKAPANTRNLIRAVFAAIEGLHWQLKRDVLKNGLAELTPHEHAAMLEEAYVVDGRGNVNSTSRFLPLATAIRLVVNVVQRYRPKYVVDFDHAGWSNLKSAIEVRNRLVHPKVLEDLSVTEDEVEKAMSGFCWILALVIEVLQETHAALDEYYPPPRDSA